MGFGFGELLYLAIGGVAAFLGWLASGKLRGTRKEGRSEAEQEAKNADYENAADIRRRADDAEGVRDDTARGYRPRKPKPD